MGHIIEMSGPPPTNPNYNIPNYPGSAGYSYQAQQQQVDPILIL